jgi:hypothetical protein
MQTSLWARIDPSAEWRVAPEGGYQTTDESPIAGSSAGFNQPNALSYKHKHFGFAVVLVVTGAIIYWTYEGKPSRVSVKANAGPLDADAGVGT